MKKLHYYFLIPVVIILSMSSCTLHRQLVYVRNVDSLKTGNFYPKTRPEYKIQNRDILYIRIYTMNEEISNLINQTMGASQQNLFQNESNMYINGYTVTDSGYVEIPILGRIWVANKTMDQAINAIRERAAQFLKDATIVVKLVSFKFSVLGEVNRPGTYTNFNNQLTILEAISMAGDITDFGNRKEVLVLRPFHEGTKTFRLDLTNKNILISDGFFLLPNDIVYIEPIKSKTFKINIPTITLALTSISTLILILNYIK
jgi:polysaccharide export outer membrane protein